MKDNDSPLPSEDVKSTEAENNELSYEENPEWDGSEAEFVEDDDSAEYEIPETGIKLSYIPTADEMYKCLYHSDVLRTKGSRAIVQSIILGIAAIVFFVVYFIGKTDYNGYNLFFGIVCLVMTVVIWTVPHLYMKSMAKMMADGKKIEFEIYPTHIDIGSDEGAWSIELDGKSEIQEFDNIFMISTGNDRNFAIPERIIEPEVYNEVRAILLSGCAPVQGDSAS